MTSANVAGAPGPQELVSALPPPPMFCTVCSDTAGDTAAPAATCCSEPGPKPRKPNKPAKKGFVSGEHSFSTLPNVRSHSFSTKKPRKDDCKAGIQV